MFSCILRAWLNVVIVITISNLSVHVMCKFGVSLTVCISVSGKAYETLIVTPNTLQGCTVLNGQIVVNVDVPVTNSTYIPLVNYNATGNCSSLTPTVVVHANGSACTTVSSQTTNQGGQLGVLLSVTPDNGCQSVSGTQP